MTKALPLDIIEAELEFAKPCDFKSCDAEADYAIIVMHGGATCPREGFLCQGHKEEVEKIWVDVLTDSKKPLCLNCQRLITGQLSDNFRFIPL